jgi:hypothetical protein
MSNRVFETPKRTSNTQRQQTFFDEIDKVMVEELVYRTTNKVLKKHIINELKKDKIYDINVYTHIKRDTDDDISLYINFVKNNIQYAHISIHFTDIGYNKNKSGPIHLVIEYPHKIYFRIIPSIIDTVELKYANYNTKGKKSIKDILHKYPEVGHALRTLERYVTRGDEYHLHKSFTKHTINIAKENIFNKSHPSQYARNIFTKRKSRGHMVHHPFGPYTRKHTSRSLTQRKKITRRKRTMYNIPKSKQ